MVRRLIPALAALAVFAAAVPAAAQAEELSGTLAFQAKGQKQAAPCANGFQLCGPVSVSPVGTADFGWTPVGLTGEDGNCLFADEIAVFAFSPDDVLVLDISAHPCFPGGSSTAPGSLKSFGNPVNDTGTWTVSDESTGIFAGATGSGTDTLHWAGAKAFFTFTGTVDY